MAQEVKPSNKDFTYGLRGGVALTNYANNYVGNGKEAVKPVVGIFLEKPIFTNISAQIGLNYAPHTVKSYGPTLRSKEHFHYLQLAMNGLFSLTRNSNWPLTVSGGLFGSRLLDMRIVDYDPIYGQTFVFSDWKGVYRPYNAGVALGIWVSKRWDRHRFRLGAEWQRGLMHVNSKEAVALLRLEPKTRAYWITFLYVIGSKERKIDKATLMK
jgi:hypothetical protein